MCHTAQIIKDKIGVDHVASHFVELSGIGNGSRYRTGNRFVFKITDGFIVDGFIIK